VLRKIFKWIFREELIELKTTTEITKAQGKIIKSLLGNIDVSVDVHQYAPSWAVISMQGEKADYIKFIDLGRAEIREIQKFLRQFERSKIDSAPHFTKEFWKIDHNFI
jgi:hypothetical protein